MTRAPERDPLADHLVTPENAAFLFIDHQPARLATVRSMAHALLLKNAVSKIRTIKTVGDPGRALDRQRSRARGWSDARSHASSRSVHHERKEP
jgi:hypothetical protein